MQNKQGCFRTLDVVWHTTVGVEYQSLSGMWRRQPPTFASLTVYELTLILSNCPYRGI